MINRLISMPKKEAKIQFNQVVFGYSFVHVFDKVQHKCPNRHKWADWNQRLEILVMCETSVRSIENNSVWLTRRTHTHSQQEDGSLPFSFFNYARYTKIITVKQRKTENPQRITANGEETKEGNKKPEIKITSKAN